MSLSPEREPVRPFDPPWPIGTVPVQVPLRSLLPPRPARVPRRFGIGTLMVFTTMYAVLFSLLRLRGDDPATFLVIATFFTAIGLGQILLFKGKKPREASVWVGVPTAAVLFVGLIAFHGDHAGGWPLVLIGGLPFVVGLAVPASYVVGCLLAGVFLIADRLRTGKWNPEGNELNPDDEILVAEVVDEPEDGRLAPGAAGDYARESAITFLTPGTQGP